MLFDYDFSRKYSLTYKHEYAIEVMEVSLQSFGDEEYLIEYLL
jgi:hypothetical protein